MWDKLLKYGRHLMGAGGQPVGRRERQPGRQGGGRYSKCLESAWNRGVLRRVIHNRWRTPALKEMGADGTLQNREAGRGRHR